MITSLGKIALVALGLALGARVEAATYTIIDLGNTVRINGFQSKVLNDHGEIIGNEIGDSGRAQLYTGGSWKALPPLNTSGTGNTGTVAHGLNNSALVVGEGDTGLATPAFDQTDGFFVSGPMGNLGALGLVGASNPSQVAIGYGCNDRGAIVGNVIDYSAGTRDTFVFLPGAGIVSRVTDPVFSFAINRHGDVLSAAVALVPQAVLNGVALPKVAGFVPHAINNSGQILLSADASNPLPAGWGLIYDYGTGKTTVLPNLSPESVGYTTFLDLNDAGDVVGRGSDENLVPHAVLYTAADGLTSLDALGLTVGGNAVHLTEAHGINNAGQIVCLGYTTDPADIHGYLLTPDAVPALPLVAAYDGLASVLGANLGSVVVAVGKTSIASVKLQAPGVSYSFKVTLDANGAFNGQVTVKGVALAVDLSTDAPRRTLAGTIADGTTSYGITALRRVKLGIFTGKYTALLQLAAPAPGLPQGIGHGQMSVSKTGAIKIAGQLGDGAKYSASAFPRFDGTWAFYAPLYAKTAQPGGIAGVMAFDRAAAESDCAGILKWNKPGDFLTDAKCQAALVKAVKDTQLLRFTNPTAGVATFAFAGGEQTLAPHTLSVTNKNVVSVTAPAPDPDELAVKLSSKGTMTGSFLHPVTGKTSFTGVLQQKLNRGGGVFQGETTAGSVLLTPQ